MILNKYGEILENVNLENYNTYGIKTITKYLIKPNGINDLKDLIKYLSENSIKYYCLGGGSNIILPDNEFNGVIISLEKLNNLEINDTKVEVECGIHLSKFVLECINNSLGGLEYLALIPGSLGGALYGNAGVGEHTIYDFIESVTVIRNNELVTLLKEDIKISYRFTEFKNTNDLIVKAVFNLYKADIDGLKETVKENRIKRQKSQPLEYKNAGSVFKNPPGDYAGGLIESLGLKGYTIGGAKISEKHANFIINTGNATGKDIRDLIKYVQEKVRYEYNIDLELEQIIIDWE